MHARGLERGESAKSYLIGDESLCWKEFFELWFTAAGRSRDLSVEPSNVLPFPRDVWTCNGFAPVT